MARILVIDDNAEIRTTLMQTLQAAGHEVALAEDGNQGIELCSSKPVELVVTDLFMPNQEGMATIMELRRHFPKVAIIAMSGKPGAANLLSIAKRLGAAKVLEKPFQPYEFVAAVEEVLGVKS